MPWTIVSNHNSMTSHPSTHFWILVSFSFCPGLKTNSRSDGVIPSGSNTVIYNFVFNSFEENAYETIYRHRLAIYSNRLCQSPYMC